MAEKEPTYKLPPNEVWAQVAKLSIVDDKPIMLDYWTDSLEKKVLIGLRKDTEEKLLVKNAEEYTSPVSKIYRLNGCFIICTENSIYLVSADIPTKYIN
jgi:hypothetical protein